MVPIPGGTFNMGSLESEPERHENETRHSVTLNSFYMYETQVLLVDYLQVMGYITTWFFADYRNFFGEYWPLCPADGVTWYEAVEFCNKLSEMEGFTPAYTITDRRPATGYPIISATIICNWDANGYRLPTEAEWEYACRAGTTGPFHTGDNINPPADETDYGQANYNGEYPYNGNDPGICLEMPIIPYFYEDESNNFGLISMHGNLEEWCWDWYGENYYQAGQTDPHGPNSGTWRVTRGGSWGDVGQDLRSAMRYGYSPNDGWLSTPGLPYVGFRFVRNAPGVPSGSRAAELKPPISIAERSAAKMREFKLLPQDIPQGIRTFDKNSPVKPQSLRRKGL
jgi:formylglycine-generating enzyme required for sulfatase activity